MVLHIIRSQDCGNSPKNQLVEDLAVSLMSGDISNVSNLVSEAVVWEQTSGTILEGQAALCHWLESQKQFEFDGTEAELIIHHVLSHGRSGAVDGIIRAGSHHHRFCHIFEFSSASGKQVKRIISY